MSSLKRIDVDHLKVSCKECNLRELCFPHGMSDAELLNMDAVVDQPKPLHKNDFLYRDGDSSRAIYAVRSGCVKTMTESANGDEQIVGFHLPGELLGLDGFAEGVHTCNALALETSSVCELPLNQLENLCHVLPGLQKQMRRIMGKEVNNDHKLLLLLGKMTAEERLASFLLSLSSRMEERHWKDNEFNLSMPRQDIANYLGMAVETVSRLFATFQNEKIIDVDRRHITILDMQRLKAIVGECDTEL
ncbi:MAG: fumarate/nitrate reduction transcriptional regulator Fnr [Gammaproteobacteria bacterium]|nr:fumarate/nitrate reduction transcriptional regulator Fnr [Gammaproteobacteria bacterium]MBT8133944.1 fumarate/nitrate reduction transcriptional regulator Fnr [Gammaproteobacteria bacterium]NNJ51389.1 fumarate/nitrate reduction transcriptional regulator Fnr [Gammaproteobacteria bacterium]